ncbi:MAG TPA: hypothetical protein VGE04_00175, partial [Chloroflexia bacterium]
MFKRSHERVALLALLGLVLQLLPTGVQGRELPTLSSIQNCSGLRAANATPFNTPYFGHPSFEKLWRRTDQLVARGQANRSWYWGPIQISGPIKETFSGTTHIVQYFEKTRMEINDPGHPDQVTNGLLSNELISGYMQVGEDQFERHDPAPYVIAGDPGGPDNPTYASFTSVSNTEVGNHYQPNRLTSQPQPQYATATIDRAGTVGNDLRYAGFAFRTATQIAYFDSTTQHNIPRVFWDYLNACGPIVQGETVVNDRLINDPWWSASGLPISDAYWARVTLFNQPEDVLIQAFERRVLTYRPGASDPNFRVEMGNIGAHYVQWRYPRGVPGQAEVWLTTRDGGKICRKSDPANCPPAVVRSAYSGVAYYEDTIRVNDSEGSTVNARAAGTYFLLDKGSAMRLQPRVELSLVDEFLLTAGTALFHHDGQGDIKVEAGDTVMVPIGTEFSVQLRTNGSVKIAVLEGSLRVSTTDGQKRVLGQGKQEQLVVPPRGTLPPSAPSPPLPPSESLDDETRRLWDTYGDIGPNVPPGGSGGQGAFAYPAFKDLWARTDSLVAAGQAMRTFFWGPTPGETKTEQYADAPDGTGTRPVQYFDKGRMEMNLPSPLVADLHSYVTNGLLTVELISGKMQVGNSQYQTRYPANIPLASDNDDANAPTYATFLPIANSLLGDHPAVDRTGATINEQVNKAGIVFKNVAFEKYGAKYGFYNTETKHNIADKMWDFLNSTGPVINPDGSVVNTRLSDPWFNVTGYAISEPYWANVKIGGKQMDVLIQ